MDGYLGEIDVSLKEEFCLKTPYEWALTWIELYGQFDGNHHKAWVLDQVARILKGTSVIVKEAKWSNGHSELRYSLGSPSKEYEQWVEDMLGESDKDGTREYTYDIGIPP